MTPFCTITPSRGDRPELLDFCKYQLSRMTLKPERSYFIDHPPQSDKVDLVDRVQRGVQQAKADGFEYVFIIEDDDSYPVDYFSNFSIGDYAFYGSQETIYYNLRNRTYNTFEHKNRSSLFITGFCLSHLNGFNWYAPKSRFLDVTLWEYATAGTGVRQFITPSGVIGIKHNLGLCAGRGHQARGKFTDDDLQWLKDHTDSEQFDFYSQLIKKL